MTTELPLACWYPNPTGEPRQMYWDGEGWYPPEQHADYEALPPPPPSGQRPRRQVKVALIAAMVVVLAAAGITGCVRAHSPQTPSAQPAPPPRQTVQPAQRPRQTVLPFTGLKSPSGVAVDNAGDLYVTDTGDVPGASGRVLKLAARSATPTVLPFTGLNYPWGVAVDTGGNLYVVDAGNLARDPWGRRAWAVKLPAGSSTQTQLPFTGLINPTGVAVDAAGNLYLADSRNNRVLKLAAGSSTQAVLPFTGLNYPTGVAVDTVGNVYVTDRKNSRVVKLTAR